MPNFLLVLFRSDKKTQLDCFSRLQSRSIWADIDGPVPQMECSSIMLQNIKDLRLLEYIIFSIMLQNIKGLRLRESYTG